MARFVTPAKIGLLALIELYTCNAVPTTSTIPILSFIISHLIPSSLPKPQNAPLGGGGEKLTASPTGSFLVTIKDYKALLGAHSAAVGLPGRTLYDLFLEKLWALDSLDALHEFFDDKALLLALTKEQLRADAEAGLAPPDESKILLSRTSPFGAFVRKSQLEFTRLKFHDSVTLWRSFCVWRAESETYWRKRLAARGGSALAKGPWGFDVNLAEEDERWGPEKTEELMGIAYGGLGLEEQNGGGEGLISTDDVEKLLEFQVEQMQKLGNRVPETVQEQFQNLMSSNVVIPSLSHYVNFLDAWRAGDYPTSFDNLHRFFDYTMQNRDRLFYQYALLNLAVLQADFGCYQEAVAAMQETVATARENKDMGCLNFSLSWLYHFGKAHPTIMRSHSQSNLLGVERESLAFLRVKAKESSMWSLWSSSLLSEAKMSLSAGESVATAFENIVRSSQLTITKNMMSNVGAQMMLQSSLWSRLGNTHLAWSYIEIFLRVHSVYAPFDDMLKFTCRASFILSQKGKYDEALARIEELDPNSLRSLITNQYWLRFRGLLRLKRDLHNHNLTGAKQLLSQLLPLTSSTSGGGDLDITFELQTLNIDYLTRLGDYATALSTIETLAIELKENGDDIFFRVKLLILKALLLDRCGRPQRGFSIAVRAATIAWRARLLPALWHATGALANILNSLGEYAASAQILASIIPRALEVEDCAVSAQLFAWVADAHMGMAGKAEAGSSKRTENLTKALEAIERSFAEWSAVADWRGMCQMMAKKSAVARALGDVGLSNDYAAAYLALKKEEGFGGR